MEIRSKKSYCINCRVSESGPRLPVRNQAGIENYAAGTNSSPEHPSGSQNQEKPSLCPLDSPSPKKKQKPKRINWTWEE